MRTVLIILMVCLAGCRSTKSSLKVREDNRKMLEHELLGTAQTQQESNVLTYWPDGSLYQFEQRKLMEDQAVLGRLKMEEKQKVSQTTSVKEQYPWKIWKYPVLAIGLVLMLWVYWKFKK